LTSLSAARADESDYTQFWWLYLVTGAAWLLLAVIVFRFDWGTVSSISILFGIVMIAAGVTELFGAFAAHGWWRLAYVLLAIAFVTIGFVAFAHPGGTFEALAAVMSFYFIVKGGFDVALGIATHGEEHFWWLRLTIGIAEVLIGFWAAGYFGRSAVLLVVWVGATALTRGLSDVLAAFAVRAARHA
jgi:uncharacterized membrane protein HdeD (DUF308 family)